VERLPSGRKTPKTSLKWKANTNLEWSLTHNTDERTVWEAGEYRLTGRGRTYGGGIRRDWVLRRGDTVLGRPDRLSEGKQMAERDFRTQQAIAKVKPYFDLRAQLNEVEIARKTELPFDAALSLRIASETLRWVLGEGEFPFQATIDELAR